MKFHSEIDLSDQVFANLPWQLGFVQLKFTIKPRAYKVQLTCAGFASVFAVFCLIFVKQLLAVAWQTGACPLLKGMCSVSVGGPLS
ncbi:hypothetical protein C7T94_08370 [Pedobacter yulinensis]|uniref:Uncharacterized protein n=1 Tax=Pedobacter yulinensis TaxID=2126353 RepID=A0A2T3HJP2_9SPHI|nr:hypothetical protein C7T94_08370 [Pedobacter yulinensis]